MPTIAEICERLKAASPYPWDQCGSGFEDRNAESVMDFGLDTRHPPNEADADLIANAPSDLEYLLGLLGVKPK